MSYAAKTLMHMPISVLLRACALADMFARTEVETCAIGLPNKQYRLTNENDQAVHLIEEVEPVLRSAAEYLVDRQLASWVDTGPYITLQLHINRFPSEFMTDQEQAEDPRR